MKVNFEEVLQDITKLGTKVTTDKYQKQGDYPIIDQGQKFIAGYLSGCEGLLEDIPVIIFGDHTRVLKYVDFPFFLGADGVKVLKVKNTNFLSKYVFYNLCATAIPDTGYNRHFKWLKQANLKAVPLETQQKIINSLDEITALIDKHKQQLEKLDLLVKSSFIEMFGDVVYNDKTWAHYPMSTVAPIGTYKGKIEPVNGKFWLLNLDMIEAQTGEIINEVLVDFDKIGASTVAFNKDNVLYSKLRPYLNKVVNPKKEGYATSELVPLNPKQRILNKVFLTALLRSDTFVHYIQEQVAGAKMPRVSMDVFRKFEVICPPIDLQNEFASFVEQTDKTKSKIKQSLEKFDILKKALMQKYFG